MSNLSVRARNITLPEFSKSLQVDHHVFWVHDNENVRYDAIIGRDLVQELKLDICYSNGTMKMEGQVVLMKEEVNNANLQYRRRRGRGRLSCRGK